MTVSKLLRQARQYFEREQFDLAAEIYEKILYQEPENIEALLGIAKISYKTNFLQDAKKFCLKISEIQPENPELWLLMGLIFEDEDPEKALEYLKMALDLAPNSPLHKYHFARVLAKNGYLEDARILVEDAIKQVPDDLDLRMLEARIYRDLDAPRDAIFALQKAIELSPHHLPAYLELVDILVLEGEVDLALDMLTEARANCGSSLQLDVKESGLRAFVGDWDRAAELSANIVRRVPDSSQAWINHGVFLSLQGDLEGAEKAFWHAQKADESNWEPWFLLGEIYEAADLSEKAEEAYRQAMELDPLQWKPLNNLALFLMKENPSATKEAITLLQKAIQLDASQPEPIINLALACFKIADYDTAQKLLDELREFDSLPENILVMMENLQEELNDVLHS